MDEARDGTNSHFGALAGSSSEISAQSIAGNTGVFGIDDSSRLPSVPPPLTSFDKRLEPARIFGIGCYDFIEGFFCFRSAEVHRVDLDFKQLWFDYAGGGPSGG